MAQCVQQYEQVQEQHSGNGTSKEHVEVASYLTRMQLINVRLDGMRVAVKLVHYCLSAYLASEGVT